MALDIGEKRVGIAVSDATGRIASPVKVLPASEVIGMARPFRMLLEDYEPEILVCGRPMTLAGEEGPQAARVMEQARAIGRAAGLPVAFADERLSSTEASPRAYSFRRGSTSAARVDVTPSCGACVPRVFPMRFRLRADRLVPCC